MRIGIAQEIFERFPTAKVSFSIVEVMVMGKTKGDQQKFISEYKQRIVRESTERGINLENYQNTRVCASWNRVFSTFNAGDDKKSTIENLLKRVCEEADKVEKAKATGKTNAKADLGHISNFVDLYNCISIDTLTPMGALDLSTVNGDITIRMGKEGETFVPLARERIEYEVKPDHVVYADNKNILTWLWNYRDAAHCCVPKDSGDKPTYILLFADQADSSEEAKSMPIWERPGDVDTAIDLFKQHLGRIGGRWVTSETLTKEKPEVVIDLSSLSSSSSSSNNNNN